MMPFLVCKQSSSLISTSLNDFVIAQCSVAYNVRMHTDFAHSIFCADKDLI